MKTRLARPAGETHPSAARDARVASCETAAGLGAINRSGVAMAIWRRSLPLCLGTWIDRLDASTLPSLRILVRTTDLRRAFLPLLAGSDMTAGAMRDLLVDDVEALVTAFSSIARCDLVDVRLERITDDACCKFHCDNIELRLLTTYRGATTQWVEPAHAAQALAEQKGYTGPLQRLQLYDVAVFKGRQSDLAAGIVHRSPPIAGLGVVRWLLCLNKPTRVSPEAWSDA
jgi:Protein of unknown function (DUF1826).